MRIAIKSAPFPAVAILVGCVCLLCACQLLSPNPGPAQNPGGSTPPPPAGGGAAPDLGAGAQLYAQSCATCHGDSAQGTSLAPDIRGRSGIAAVVRSGRGNMLGFPSITDTQIASLELFLKRFSLPADGPGLYASMCARCHGDSAKGTALGPGLAQAQNVWQVASQGQGQMPAVSGISKAQAEVIARWLAGLPFPSTGRDLYMRFCMQCHGADARGTQAVRRNIRGGLGDLYEAVRFGEDNMPAFPQIDQAGVERMRAYIKALP